ncbi:hypothetical protein SAMD00019534_064970 [Acytostelium subglobosum LB1]|uniref:hypothetical protein n=1 Tax=Acytostelium subglobosum LB1 TaxID=1410327 RepID=UPI000644A6EF|nr:hypothetical protein SAMD00019534_064970 [Acytostelium subglobosum LB1]GAM23322.1 hypothetical protein SAMD00019534_064970 [Acytostelium subglobosum LB1]|eukprot:XP_012753771.1 hypothetical protein SAMD00019534_064970 [Acytostelium subglobosum LB1]
MNSQRLVTSLGNIALRLSNTATPSTTSRVVLQSYYNYYSISLLNNNNNRAPGPAPVQGEENEFDLDEFEEEFGDEEGGPVPKEDQMEMDMDDDDDYGNEGADEEGAPVEGKEYSEVEVNELIGQTQTEIYRHLLDCPKPLDSEVKMKIYRKWQEDPKYYNTKRLSDLFKIHRGRIAAIIRFQQIYEQEVAAGNRVFDDLETDIAKLLGTRMQDEYLGEEDDHSDKFFFVDGKTDELALEENDKNNSGKRPAPLHEVPTVIPKSFPEKPVYFRGPTLSRPKRKNLIFIDNSRDPFTNRANRDPMMLINGIDGSLRTPSTSERKLILDHIRKPKVSRDPDALLKRPLKYKVNTPGGGAASAAPSSAPAQSEQQQ